MQLRDFQRTVGLPRKKLVDLLEEFRIVKLSGSSMGEPAICVRATGMISGCSVYGW
jgi:hypothetical protein